MSPRRSKTSVLPSGDASTDIQVPSVASKAILRASARGLLMSRAMSGFLSFVSVFAGSLAAALVAADPVSRATVRKIRSASRMSPPLRRGDYLPSGPVRESARDQTPFDAAGLPPAPEGSPLGMSPDPGSGALERTRRGQRGPEVALELAHDVP